MKKSQQVNSRRRSKMASKKRRRHPKSPYQCNLSRRAKDIIVILFPAEMSEEEDSQLRIAVDRILAPVGRPFSPLTWEAEKNGAIVVLPRSVAKIAVARLSALEQLGMMIVDGQYITVMNFGDEMMP